MSKFIASSVNYSETNMLKTKYLSHILELYNQEMLEESRKLVDNVQQYIIPNNNKKYYLLIVNKNDITPNNINSKYKICYFFPENYDNTTSDFFVEIDNYKTTFPHSNYLFEGYLYNINDQKHFLISDILAVDSKIIKCDYFEHHIIIILHQELNTIPTYPQLCINHINRFSKMVKP